MPSAAQLQKIWLLSDTALYTEAVNFIHELVEKRHCEPLPAAQANGLLNIAGSSRYSDLYQFVVHQRDRDWPSSKRDIKRFYTDLEQFLSQMQRKRLREEFRLLADVRGRSVSDLRREADELLILLAREFIQHLVAENSVLAAKAEEARAKRRRTGGR
ncbi:MAG: hypothetical protein IMW89_02875 [Ktedonobacteraceae bacterium]|nr:hypothetical protein [Ktedonobacteraceae bacterium]